MRRAIRGFTLLETIIYTALTAFIISGALATAYNLVEGSRHLDTNALVQEEGNFVVRKIDWVFSAASDFDILTPQKLFVIRSDGMRVVITLAGSAVSMSEDGGTSFLPLTNSRVAVSGVSFEEISAVGSGPKGVKATLTIASSTFSTVGYVPK